MGSNRCPRIRFCFLTSRLSELGRQHSQDDEGLSTGLLLRHFLVARRRSGHDASVGGEDTHRESAVVERPLDLDFLVPRRRVIGRLVVLEQLVLEVVVVRNQGCEIDLRFKECYEPMFDAKKGGRDG